MRTGSPFTKLLVFEGETLDEMFVENPFTGSSAPVLINNEVTPFFGSGANIISPAHNLESLQASYHYGLSKKGYVDERGNLTVDAGAAAGLNVLHESTNKKIVDHLKSEGSLFCSYPYKNEFYKMSGTEERVILRADSSWFLNVPERLQAKCMDELSTTKFIPKLNLKSTEETHQDFDKKRKNKNAKIESYYLNVVEELADFNDWCVSDSNKWGVPVPYFKYKDTGKILMDQEIVEHFAQLIESHGSSDIWYSKNVDDLLPPRYRDQARELSKGYQVFDSWFDSSLSWAFLFRDRDYHEERIAPLKDQIDYDSLQVTANKRIGGGRRGRRV